MNKLESGVQFVIDWLHEEDYVKESIDKWVKLDMSCLELQHDLNVGLNTNNEISTKLDEVRTKLDEVRTNMDKVRTNHSQSAIRRVIFSGKTKKCQLC